MSWLAPIAAALRRAADRMDPLPRPEDRAPRRFTKPHRDRRTARLEAWIADSGTPAAQRAGMRFLLAVRRKVRERGFNLSEFRRTYLPDVSQPAFGHAIEWVSRHGFTQTDTVAHYARSRIARLLNLEDLYQAALDAAKERA